VSIAGSKPAAALEGPPPAWPVLNILACPECRGELEPGSGIEVRCRSCGHSWGESEGWLDFRASDTRLNEHWSERQASMEGWYENLITSSRQAEDCWRHDYDPLADVLTELRGRVLDIGGGNGVVRQYLDASAECVVLDPSPQWLRRDWLRVAEWFPALLSPLTFVLGVGERLPFAPASFDAVLALFSINHMAEPARLVREARRVLRPGGRLLIVVEDVEPRWRDLASPGYRAGWTPLRRAIPQKIAATLRLRSWPTHPEHVAITESALRSWLDEGFDLRRRRWVAGWLTLDATRRTDAGAER
jgi:SAM-dependent methyltransferase